MMKITLLTFCAILACIISLASGYVMSDITKSVLPSDMGENLNIAAFGDYNSDKLVDIFVLSKAKQGQGTSVELLIAQEKISTSPSSAYVLAKLIDSPDRPIHSVVPADFDGDAQMDILVTHKDSSGNVEVKVYWGESNPKNLLKDYVTLGPFLDQPLVLDCFGNMIPDLLCEDATSGKRVRWHTDSNRKFVESHLFPDGNYKPFLKPHSNSFVDINRDLSADIIITNEKKEFEIWINQKGEFQLNKSIPYPDSHNEYLGQSAWIDIDQNSEPDLLLPCCDDPDCKSAGLCVWHGDKWIYLSEMFEHDKEGTYGYVLPGDNPAHKLLGLDIPVTLHMGDYDMDGYPDFLVLLKNSDSKSQAFLLMNVECGKPECSKIGRTFTVLWTADISAVNDVAQVTFFDIYEDGVLDILLVAQSNSTSNSVALKAFKNTYSPDACFMKITVVSGICYNNCPEKRTPYGINQPGVAVSYDTTKPNGAPTQGCATQLYQSAHFALQLPYTIFGLGQMPNFVDKMRVGIPKNLTDRTNSWAQIIPNTQLIVIPYPKDDPRYWVMKLYVKPSEAILITGAVLIGCLGVVAAILGGLCWKERKEDQEEKKQESQKFHFDAM